MPQSNDPSLGINSWLEDELFYQYQFDRKSVDEGWTEHFQHPGQNGAPGPATALAAVAGEAPPSELPLPLSKCPWPRPRPFQSRRRFHPLRPQFNRRPRQRSRSQHRFRHRSPMPSRQLRRRPPNRNQLPPVTANNLSLCAAPRLASPRTWPRAFRFLSPPPSVRSRFESSKKIATHQQAARSAGQRQTQLHAPDRLGHCEGAEEQSLAEPCFRRERRAAVPRRSQQRQHRPCRRCRRQRRHRVR